MTIKKQALAIWNAIKQIPGAIAQTVVRVLESSEILVYTFIAVGCILIGAYVMEGVGYLIKETGHISYLAARDVDTFAGAILHTARRILRFFHSHIHTPEVNLERHLDEFKSSDPDSICHELASYGAMLAVFPRMSWSRHVCPVLRYFTDTPIDTIIGPFISWASYDWAPEGNNCHKPRHLTICIVCEFYLFMRLIALALVIVLIVAPAWPLFLDLLDIAYHTFLLTCDIVFDLLYGVASGIHKLRTRKKKI